jgi:hypothetical protein
LISHLKGWLPPLKFTGWELVGGGIKEILDAMKIKEVCRKNLTKLRNLFIPN